jgi:ribokinase
MSCTITIVGSLNYDLVTFTQRVPDGGETILADNFESHLGGKGLNEAIATARLLPSKEIKVRMIGNVGNDNFGTELKQSLIDCDVDTNFIRTVSGPSGVAVILVESSGENRILVTPGANGKLRPSPEELDTYFPISESNQYVILQNEFPHTGNVISWLKTYRPTINICYNPSPFLPELLTTEILSKIDLLIVNEGEAVDVATHLLSDVDTKDFSKLATQLKTLINPGNIQTIIITMGSKGSIFVDKAMDCPKFVLSLKVDCVVDTTGAGDTFFGGVVLQLASGSTLKDAITFATAASGIVVQSKGAVESIPSYSKVQPLIQLTK